MDGTKPGANTQIKRRQHERREDTEEGTKDEKERKGEKVSRRDAESDD